MAARKGPVPVAPKSLGIFGAVPIPIVGVTPQGLVQELTPSAITLLAINKGTDAQGKSFVDIFVLDEDRQAVRARFAEALGGASKVGGKATFVRLTTRNGRKDTMLRITPSRGADNRIEALALCFQEVSDLRSLVNVIDGNGSQMSSVEDAGGAVHQYAVEGQWASDMLARTLFGASACMFATDVDGIITVANAKCEQIFGKKVDELVGSSVFHMVSDESTSNLQTGINYCMAGKRCTNFLLQVPDSDEVTTLVVALSPQRDGNAEPIGILMVCIEMPEGLTGVGGGGGGGGGAGSNKASMGLGGSAEGDNDGGTKGMVMHELRSPLHGIIGLTNTLAQDPSPMQKPLKMIGSSAVRVLELVTNLMDFWHLVETPSGSRFQDTLNLGELVNEALSHCDQLVDKRGKPLKKKDVATVKEIPSVIPVVPGDIQNVSQMLYHLLSNAFKFTLKGQVSIVINPGDDCVHISVSDTGVGINNDSLDRIFGPFQQEDCSESRKYEGIGLGLAIVKEVVRVQGGKIKVISTPDQGSSFNVTLPCKPPVGGPGGDDDGSDAGPSGGGPITSLSAAPVKAEGPDTIVKQFSPALSWLGPKDLVKPPVFAPPPKAAPKPETMDTRGAMYRMGPMTPPRVADADRPRLIMSVDDDHVNQEVMRSVLEPHGFRIVVCMSGAECLQHIEQEKDNLPDLVLLDLMMPGLNGFDVLTVVRKQFTCEAMPILMVSAKNQVASVVKGLELGCNDWIHKPFDRTELVARVKMQLRTRETVEGYKAMAMSAEGAPPPALPSGDSQEDKESVAEERPPSDAAAKPVAPVEPVQAPTAADTSVLFMTPILQPGFATANEWSELFVNFDKIAAEMGIKTTEFLGSCYIAVLNKEDESMSITDTIIKLAIKVASTADTVRPGMKYAIGIHEESKVAPFVSQSGNKVKTLFGSVVSLAKVFSEHGSPGRIRVSAFARSKISSAFETELKNHGHQWIQGQKPEPHWVLMRKDEPALPAPVPEMDTARATQLQAQSAEASSELTRLQAELTNTTQLLNARKVEVNQAEGQLGIMRQEFGNLQHQIAACQQAKIRGDNGSGNMPLYSPPPSASPTVPMLMPGQAPTTELGARLPGAAPLPGAPALFLQWQNAHLQAELTATQEELATTKSELQVARMNVQQTERKHLLLTDRVEHLELDINCMSVCSGMRPHTAFMHPDMSGAASLGNGGSLGVQLDPMFGHSTSSDLGQFGIFPPFGSGQPGKFTNGVQFNLSQPLRPTPV